MSGYACKTLVKTARGAAAGLLVPATLLTVCAVTVAGCGETAGTPAATQSAPTTTRTAAGTGSSASTAVATTPKTVSTQTSSTARPASSGHVRRSRAHLVLPPPGSHPAPKLSASDRASVSVADITLSSPAITQRRSASAATLGREYTCRGADHSPSLHWTGIPPGTKELALFAISIKPVAGKLFFDWAVANLNPGLKGLDSNTLPPGAVLGRNGSGHAAYSICPIGAKHEDYVFVLYALPQSLSPKPNFDPAYLRQQAIRIARHTGLLVGSYG
jgi:phosphatidylethanolamine-binding protein (PEBP) family uncharacterized protein